MTETGSPAALLVGLAAFAAAADLSVGKDGTNPHFNYSYMTEPALFTAARAALAANRLSATISFEAGQHETVETINRDGKASPAILATVTACLTVRDTEGHEITARAFGQGLDPADKAYAKAMTMAAKYVVQKALMIAVDADDTDNENSGTVRRTTGGAASEGQLGFVCSLIKQVGIDGGDAERMALRLARMAGDSAPAFPGIGKATASGLIERLQKVKDNPAAAAVITERLTAFETEHGYSTDPMGDANLPPVNPEPQPTDLTDAKGDPLPF